VVLRRGVAVADEVWELGGDDVVGLVVVAVEVPDVGWVFACVCVRPEVGCDVDDVLGCVGGGEVVCEDVGGGVEEVGGGGGPDEVVVDVSPMTTLTLSGTPTVACTPSKLTFSARPPCCASAAVDVVVPAVCDVFADAPLGSTLTTTANPAAPHASSPAVRVVRARRRDARASSLPFNGPPPRRQG
jgi:hypothetical protein